MHVSDIIPTNCIRRQFYGRKFPEMAPLNHESVHHFVRGEASEFVITKLASLGVSQVELNMDGIIAHPDIMSNDLVVELKDTINGKRLDFSDTTFKSYLRQLLVLSDYNRNRKRDHINKIQRQGIAMDAA